MFGDEQKGLEFRLDDLMAEQEDQLGLLKKLPEDAVRAVGRVRARLSEIDAEMAATEAMLVNVADEFGAAQRDCQRLGAEWEAAKTALETEAGARAKAEAVRKVIERIVWRSSLPAIRGRPASWSGSISCPLVHNTHPVRFSLRHHH